MASALPGVWGIDLGQCALKALRLQIVNGAVTATAFDYIEHPKILSQPDADPDQLTRAALEQFLSRNQTRGDQIAISVPGQTGLARFVKLPPVEAKKIPDIVKFEAKQQIPFPLEEVVWDWQTLGVAGETEGFVENEIGLFAMKRDMIARYLQAFKDVNVEVHFVQMSPLSLCNYVTFDLLGKGSVADAGKKSPTIEESPPEEGLGEKNCCCVALDIGADNTNLVVTDGERIIWQRPIPIGGNHFTRALTKDLKLTFAKAEHLKRNATKAEDPKKIFQSMKPVFSDFVGELQRSLGFFTNTHRNAQIKKVIGLGNAFRLPGLQKFISQSMGMELEKLGSFRRLKGEEVLRSPVYGENVLSFGVAYGLALQGLAATRLSTNLLPQEIQMERVVRAKKPWVAAAAAAILVGITMFSFFASKQYALSQDAADAAEKAKRVLDDAALWDRQFTEKQVALSNARKAAAAMMRGGQERTNWPMMLRYINEGLPQPNGANLPAKYLDDGVTLDQNCPRFKYWQINELPVRAADRLREREEQGLKDETDLDNLVQVNLQSILARWCDGTMPTNFFNNIKDKRDGAMEPDTLLHADWTKPPAKPGWAFEIRGYTYHKDGVRFIMETFLENLRTGKKKVVNVEKKTTILEKGVVAPLNDPAPRWVPLEVSHVALFRVAKLELPPGGQARFQYIESSPWLNILVAPPKGGGAGGALPPGGAAGGGAAGLPGVPAGDGSGGAPAAPARNRGDWAGLGTSLGAGAGQAGPASVVGEAKVKSEGRKRTEFVIVLYWIEKMPTEPLVENNYEGANASGDGSSDLGPNLGGGGGPAGFGDGTPLPPRGGDGD